MRLSIRTKLLGSSLVLVALCAVIAALAVVRLGEAKTSGNDLYEQGYQPNVAAVYISSLAKDMQIQSTMYVVLAATTPPDQLDEVAKAKILPPIENDQKKIKAVIPQLKQAPAEMQNHVEAILAASAAYDTALGKILEMRLGTPAAAKVEQEINTAVAQLHTASEKLSEAGDAYAADAAKDIDDVYTESRMIVFGALGLAVILGLALALLISGSIRKGVNAIRERLGSLKEFDTASLREGLECIAEGDLTRRAQSVTTPIERISRDEIGDMAVAVNEITEDTRKSVDSYNASLDALGDMIGRVTTSAETLSAASQQMATTSDEAGRAVGEIAAAVGDVARAPSARCRPSSATRDGRRRSPRPRARPPTAADETARAAEAARDVAQRGRRRRRSGDRRDARGRATRRREVDRGDPRAVGAKLASRSAGSSTRSPASPSRPTCWRSTPRSRPPARASRAAASRSSPTRSASSPRSPSRPPRRSPSLIGEIQAETASRRRRRRGGGARRTEDGVATVERGPRGVRRDRPARRRRSATGSADRGRRRSRSSATSDADRQRDRRGRRRRRGVVGVHRAGVRLDPADVGVDAGDRGLGPDAGRDRGRAPAARRPLLARLGAGRRAADRRGAGDRVRRGRGRRGLTGTQTAHGDPLATSGSPA